MAVIPHEMFILTTRYDSVLGPSALNHFCHTPKIFHDKEVCRMCYYLEVNTGIEYRDVMKGQDGYTAAVEN
jgi:hypothetical protein